MIKRISHDDIALVGKRDVTAIEEMVNMRREQQTIVAVELFCVVARPPRLDMTGPKVAAILQSRDSAFFGDSILDVPIQRRG